jgi:hypothetical protein
VGLDSITVTTTLAIRRYCRVMSGGPMRQGMRSVGMLYDVSMIVRLGEGRHWFSATNQVLRSRNGTPFLPLNAPETRASTGIPLVFVVEGDGTREVPHTACKKNSCLTRDRRGDRNRTWMRKFGGKRGSSSRLPLLVAPVRRKVRQRCVPIAW